MNRNGQIGVGVLITLAIAIIVGMVLMQPIASNVEQGTQTVTGATTVLNVSYTGILNTAVELVGQELVTTIAVINNTNISVDVAAANYTIAECVRPSDSLKGICYTASGTDAADTVNISYSYYPEGYMDDAGSRAIYNLVILLAALAIAVIVLIRVSEGVRDFT